MRSQKSTQANDQENNSTHTHLIAQTLDSICDEIVSGRRIGGIQLKTTDARAIFHWYYKNRDKWAGTNKTVDVEAIVDHLKIKPPRKATSTNADQDKEIKCLHLKKVKVHRFAGIHKYCEEQKSPEDFEFTFEKSLTLVEGDNGSGKTALANAIVWCLTGHVFRSQRAPEKINDEIQITTSNDSQEEFENTCTAITPIPEKKILQTIKDKKLHLDTWVELTFEDNDGNEVGQVKRSICRTPRGKLQIDVTGIDKLGLDPIALEVGTKMAGLIPFIQIGEASEIGKAISSLTGLRPLEDLVKHALKSQEKLKGALKKEREEEIKIIDSRFDEIHAQLKELIDATSSISITLGDYADKADKLSNLKLKTDANSFHVLENEELEKGKSILGEDFDPNDSATRNDLTDNTGKALGMLDPSNLILLPSIQLMSNIKKLTSEEITTAKNLIEQIILEGNEIEELEKQPDIAIRQRLYARIGRWIQENNHPVNTCPVCLKDLGKHIDNVTGKEILEHLKEHSAKDKEYLSKIIEEWAKSWKQRLTSSLARFFADSLEKDLPDHPIDLLINAMSDSEFFKSEIFKKSLSPLKEKTRELCLAVKKEIAGFEEPQDLVFSEYFIEKCKDLHVSLGRLNRAIAFAEWRKKNDDDCKEAFKNTIGFKPQDDASEEAEYKNTLYSYLSSLDQLVKNTVPLREALLKLKEMRKKLAGRRRLERRLKYYAKAAKAIDQVAKMRKLIELHVQTLLNDLSDEIIIWKDRFYSPAYIGVPKIADTDIGANGSLNIDAEVGGTKTSSRHICNSSDIRATLLAVLVSFWKHLIKKRGGLSLLVFDDLQELFDKANREKIASSMQSIIDSGAHLLLTTNDPMFGRQIIYSCHVDSIDRRRIHPIKTCRPHIVLGEFREAIKEKRDEFEKPENENVHQPARDYINHLRIYLENMLQDFFDEICPSLPPKPSLSDLIGGLKRWRTSGQEPFTGNAFSILLNEPILKSDSQFMILVNKSHHGNQSLIMYADVDKHKSHCIKAQHLVELAHEEYYRWLRRKPLSNTTKKPDIPSSTLKVNFTVPLYENLAAATADCGPSDIANSTETFSVNDLGNYAVYVINSDTLGFSIARHSRVIVRTEDVPIEDNSLVIALYKDKIHARRFLRQNDNPEVIALCAENSNPINRSPSLLLPAEEVRLLKIVGVFFDNSPDWKNNKGEAALVEGYKIPNEAKIAFNVRGDSAIPLALNGQTVLGTEVITYDQLKNNIGELVAVSFNGKDAFKRIGNAVPSQPRLRLFESIGGIGDSLLLRTEEIEDDPFYEVPLIDNTIYKISGVIYE